MKRLRFTLERLLLRGVHYRLLAAGLIVGLVAVVAGVLVRLLDPQFEELSGALWWAFLRLTDPGYLGDDEGTLSRTVSTVVTVLGYVLFLGLLIAILTQWMNDWIRRVEAGLSKLPFNDHILILGWNHRTPSIVLELLRTKGRAVTNRNPGRGGRRRSSRYPALGIRFVLGRSPRDTPQGESTPVRWPRTGIVP
jgi:hypothetical protein